MRQNLKKIDRRIRRKHHIRKGVIGSAVKPRLTVFRSHQNIYCQLIDDGRGVTLAAASTTAKEVKAGTQGKGGNRAAATIVGKTIAERAKALGITQVAFDRNGYRYHGRLKALADGAREAGLKF